MTAADGSCDAKFYVCGWFVGKAGTNNHLNVVAVLQLLGDIVRCAFEFGKREECHAHDDGLAKSRI